MPGKIFISCGQSTPEEQKLAEEIQTWLSSGGGGFHPYVAITTQSIQDVNNGIIGELKKSDYYIFIDLRREEISSGKFRGSLFTNQELAIAYAIGIDSAIFLQQRGVLLEGIGKYILANARIFDTLEEILPIIKCEIAKRKWSPRFSRNLIAERSEYFQEITFFRDLTFPTPEPRYIAHVHIKNCREDIAAINVIAHLVNITHRNAGELFVSPDMTDLKWALQQSFTRNIAPNDSIPFDAFSIDAKNPLNVYLHSASDTFPRRPIITSTGEYLLQYEVYSENFPILKFNLLLNHTGLSQTTTVELVE